MSESKRLPPPSPWIRWPLRLLAVAAVLALLATLGLVAVAGPGYRLGWFDLGTALFTLLAWAETAARISIAIGLVALLAHLLLRGPRVEAATALLTLLVGVGLAVNFQGWRNAASAVPAIHDITTDTEDPPRFVAVVPLRAGSPNPPEYAGPEAAAQQREAYPDLVPILVEVTMDHAFGEALRVVEHMGWELVAQVPEQGRIEATATTWYMGFKDDVVIRVRPLPGVGSVVDVRSKSRVGRSDVGTNARRIRAFRERLLERLPEAPLLARRG